MMERLENQGGDNIMSHRHHFDIRLKRGYVNRRGG